MSNFLNNLIAKNQDSGEFIRPQLPALFEVSLGNAGSTPTEASFAQENFVETPLIDEFPHDAFLTPREDVQSRREFKTHAMPVRIIEEEAPQNITAKQAAPLSIARGDQTEPFTPHRENATPTVLPPEIAQLASTRTSHGEETMHSESDMGTGRVVPVVAIKYEFQAGLSSDKAEDRRQVTLASIESAKSLEPGKPSAEPPPSIQPFGAAVPRATTGERPRLQSTPVMAATNRKKPAPSKPNSLPEPSIQVTIGRIEIRATPSSSSAPSKERSGPKPMSLDDYMRQRAGGGRE